MGSSVVQFFESGVTLAMATCMPSNKPRQSSFRLDLLRLYVLCFELRARGMTDEPWDTTKGREPDRFGGKNPVTVDSICKEVISRDRLLRRDWPRKYKHLTGEFLKEVLAEECRKEGLPADTFERKPAEDAIKRSPIPLKPSPSFPRTASGMVGLRSSRREYDLEFTGRWHVSPKLTVEPAMEPGEFRVTKQKFLFLG